MTESQRFAHAQLDTSAPPLMSRSSPFSECLLIGFLYYYFTSLIVIVAVVFAVDFIPLCRDHPGSKSRVDVPSAFAAWDGEWYVKIATQGYTYSPERMSSTAFFPLYPGIAGLLVKLTGLRPEYTLLFLSHAALAASFALMIAYMHRRFPSADEQLTSWTLLALGLFPTTFYFRMTYTESTFMFLTLLTMYAIECKWRPIWIAIIIGLVTASRPVGVVGIPVLALHLWHTYPDHRKFWLLRLIAYTPVCCAGLLLYMLYLWLVFGDPLAFIQTQIHWTTRSLTFTERIVGLFTLEPIRAVYAPNSPCYWANVPPRNNLLFNMHAANPVYSFVGFFLLALGARKRWLNSTELLLAFGLCAMSLWLQAGRACMASQARYASAIFPIYIVLGHILCRVKPPFAALILSVSTLLLVVYTAMFVSWYWCY